jgi:hypothetical protein
VATPAAFGGRADGDPDRSRLSRTTGADSYSATAAHDHPPDDRSRSDGVMLARSSLAIRISNNVRESIMRRPGAGACASGRRPTGSQGSNDVSIWPSNPLRTSPVTAAASPLGNRVARVGFTTDNRPRSRETNVWSRTGAIIRDESACDTIGIPCIVGSDRPVATNRATDAAADVHGGASNVVETTRAEKSDKLPADCMRAYVASFAPFVA